MIHILYGNEPYGIVKYKQKIVSQIQIPSMNLASYQGDFNLDIKVVCETVPFMEPQRVVVLDIDSLKALDNDAFQTYVSSPCSTTELIVIARNVDQRTKLFKSLKEKHYLYPCMKVSDSDLRKILISELSMRSARIQENAYLEFTRRLNYQNNDSMTIIEMVGYLDTMAALHKDITLDMVINYTPEYVEPNIFSLARLLNSSNAEELYHEISLILPKDAIGILSLLLKDFRIAYKLKYFKKEDVGDNRTAMTSLSSIRLLDCMKVLTETITNIKDGSIPDELALKMASAKLFVAINK